MPMAVQAIMRPAGPCETAKTISPSAKTIFESASTSRPPRRSMKRPTDGPRKAEINNDAENAPKNQSRETLRSAAIVSASTAGR